jgi:hypothetical protein
MSGRSASSREREGRSSAFELRTVASHLGSRRKHDLFGHRLTGIPPTARRPPWRVTSPRPHPSDSPLARAPDAEARGPRVCRRFLGCRAGRRRGRRDGARLHVGRSRSSHDSILAPRSDREERRLGTRWRAHAPCRLPPAGRTRRPCAAAPWVSSRSSSARICFSSASETRLRLTYSPQPGHVPRFPAHEKRQPQKQATSISDCLPRPAVVPADASFGL